MVWYEKDKGTGVRHSSLIYQLMAGSSATRQHNVPAKLQGVRYVLYKQVVLQWDVILAIVNTFDEERTLSTQRLRRNSTVLSNLAK